MPERGWDRSQSSMGVARIKELAFLSMVVMAISDHSVEV
jgi:hypothetical protein